MKNQFNDFTWEKMLNLFPVRDYCLSDYFKILSPDYPEFINKYLELPVMQRLKGIGLLCGTDWTSLYKNRFYYSRYDHSFGVALIVWHFTHDKKQTLAGLFHDLSTPLFSHVADFRKGDALTQSSTEEPNEIIIKNDMELSRLLELDGLTADQVCDYHVYPIADNEIPQLSADRLEYMFPSGMALEGSWTMEEIARVYNDLSVLKNEDGIDELGFRSLECAELYTYRFCMTGHVLQLNENKLTLSILAKITSLAISEGLLTEEDCMKMSEKNAMERFEQKGSSILKKYLSTFRNMTKIEHMEEKPNDGVNDSDCPEWFSVNIKVKQRYINPLVLCDDGVVRRVYEASEKSRQLIEDFLTYEDTPWAAVKLI
ncbi:MAG: HD domain-containing protein [Treponema sp.]|nr:HD domain-containing protein [Treponema sp.]